MKTVTTPVKQTLQNALKKQVLGQDDGQPFHVVLDIAPAKGTDAEYTATIEETWLSKDHWMRTVRAPGLEQTVIANVSGLHYATSGVYFPLWLHAFVMGMFSPVPDVAQWTRHSDKLEWKELPNGAKTSPCIHHEFSVGAETIQINFVNLCFNADGEFESIQGPEFGMEFSNYAGFGQLNVPHVFSVETGRGTMVGKMTVLEEPKADAHIPVVPPHATDTDPVRFLPISTKQLEMLAGDQLSPTWPAVIPWSGQFTLWVAVDKTGKVREVEMRNTDLSGFAAKMATTLVGRQWKTPVAGGTPVQVEGALVYDYPPPEKGAAKGQ
jgi:hypothetical protein